MSASKPSGNRPGRRPAGATRSTKRSRVDRTKVVGAIFAAVVVLALVAGLVLPVLTDGLSQQPGPQDPLAQPTIAASQFEQDLRAEIERRPSDPQLMVSLANLLVAQGNETEAITWYERAIELDPKRIETRLDFGAALARRGSRSDAEIQFQRAIAIDGSNADAHYLLGDLYRFWQPPRIGEAVAEFQRAIVVQPDSVAAERARSSLASMGETSGTPAASPVATPTDETDGGGNG